MNSQCFVSLRRNSTNGLSFPMNINGIHDNDLFKDHEYIKGLIENISNVAELKEFIILTLGKGDGKFVDFFFKTLSSFEVLEKLIIQYSFENDGRIEKGDIEYDFKTKEYTLTVRYEVEEDQDEEEPVFGEMGLDDWPDSWFDVEFENKLIDKYLEIYKVEMKDAKYKTNAIGDDQKCTFYGATNRNNLTRTIISYLATYCKDNVDFVQKIVQDEAFIRHSFTMIKGSYAYYSVDDQNCSVGADFEMINGEIIYNERECYGGW